jgi:protein-disulfide isomerase
MKTGVAILGFVICGAVGLAVGYSIGQADKSATVKVGPTKVAQGPAPAAAPADDNVLKVPVGASVTKGPADALVTIVEFSDFECPFCGRANPTLDQIRSTYGDKVRIAFKHNPLPFHQNAPLAHEYAIAAGEQGKFWEMHDKLFANNRALQAENLDKYAEEVGLNVGKLKEYIASGKAKQVIAADQALAAKVGARGTPNFFINGVQLVGAQPFPAFQKLVDEQLAKADKLVKSGTKPGQVYDAIMASAKENVPPPEAPKPRAQPPAVRQKVELVGDTPSKGGKQALVTIVEWSDFECPFCGRANPTIKQILDTYGDKVSIQFRHQPLSFHQNAMPAAKASWAAHRQGKFWEMHDKLFENQRELTTENFVKFAKRIGIDAGRFQMDMESPEADARVKQDMADGGKYGARGTPTFFVNGVPVRGAQPFAAFKQVIDQELDLAEKLMKDGTPRAKVYETILEKEAGKEIAGAEPSAPDRPAAPTGPVKIDLGRAPTTGSAKAPIQIVVWSDFECPFCGRVNPTLAQIKKEYGDKVNVAFKHYPLPFHRNAELAAVASIAAHKQGKFWPMHDKLFENQRALSRDDLVRYAKELGLDVGRFEKDLDDPANKSWVQSDMAEGSKVGVNGTPASFINGRLLSGAQPYPAFKQMIDAELAKNG